MAGEIRFGFPERWTELYEANEGVYRAIDTASRVAAELVAATKDSSEENVQVMSTFVSIASDSMNDVLILTGNGRGNGAMKLARGMYEVSSLAEYLKNNPSEVAVYLDFAHVSAWRHLQRVEANSPGKVPAADMRAAESDYNRVKGQFTGKKGRVRWDWTDKSIKKMAEDIGHLDRYESVYSVASELHHLPAIGLLGHELDWTKEALRVAHASFLGTVSMLHSVSRASALTDKLNDAARQYAAAWKATP